MSFYSILTDERLKQSTLEDTHDALNSESQWTIVRMSQMRVIFLQQLKRSVSFCITKTKATEHSDLQFTTTAKPAASNYIDFPSQIPCYFFTQVKIS